MKKMYSPKRRYLPVKMSALIVRAMRITIFLTLAGIMNLYATGNSQDTKLTLNLRNAKLSKVFSIIQEKTDYQFLYNDEDVQKAPLISVSVYNASVPQILAICFKNYPLGYRLVNKTVVVQPKEINLVNTNHSTSLPPPPPPIEIHGRVVNQQGQPLQNVSVLISGTTTGTTTNNDGRFTLTAPDDKNIVIEISSVGYQTKRINVGKQTEVNVTLELDVSGLSDVVVVGYGTQKKKDLTGSVSSVDLKSVSNMPVSSIDQKMIGQIAGVQIQQASGAPGSGTSIKIRGAGSLGAGTEPLYVIDGMPYTSQSKVFSNPLNFINPNDIESISILKDASAAAIYGSRGANGVVLITTKKGKKSSSSMTFSIVSGIQEVPEKGRPNMFTAKDFAELQQDQISKRVRAQENREATMDDFPLEYRYPEELGRGTNFYDMILRKAFTQNYDISFSKGAEKSLFDFSLSYMNQDGVLRHTGMKRYTAKVTAETEIIKNVKVGVNLMPSFVDLKRTQTNIGQNDVVTQALLANPVLVPFDSLGNLKPYLVSPGNGYVQPWSIVNPLFRLRETIEQEKNYSNFGSAFIEIGILPDLKFKSAISTVWTNLDYFQYVPSTIGNNNKPPTPGNGTSNTQHSGSFNWLLQNTLTYDKAIGVHRIDGVLGYIVQENTTKGFNLQANPYASDQIQTINAATGINDWGENFGQWSMVSYLARINYSYKNKYLFTTSFRTDGSSRFGYKNRYASFPSVAVAWRISQEDFLDDSKQIDNLKLRISYGKSGNDNIGNYQALATINSGQYVIGSQVVSTATMGISNPFLTWEESNEFNAGLDVGMFNERISLIVDYYSRISSDMLMNNVVPAITGFNTSIINAGSIRNKGIEVGLNFVPVQKNQINWNVAFNIAFNRNKVLSLNTNDDRILSGVIGNNFPTHVTYVGLPMRQFFGFEFMGLLTANDMTDSKVAKDITAQEGGNRYKDINGDGKITDIVDYTVLGSPWPDAVYGLTNSFLYKNFRLSVTMHGQIGGNVLDGTRTRTDFAWGKTNLNKEWLNRWISPEQPGDGKHSAVSIGNENWTWKVSSLWVDDATFLRISNLNLNYSFPEDWLNKTKVLRGLNIYFSVQNLAMFTNYRGANPEGQAQNIGPALNPGWDQAPYPLARVYAFGLNLTL